MTNTTEHPIDEETLRVSGKQTDTLTDADTASDEHAIQWHPAFVAAMKLEFAAYADQLYFESEHNLNQKPIVADLLLIKKENIHFIDHDIGRLLKNDNLFEYKGVNDILDIRRFAKAVAYVYLYASHSTAVKPIHMDELSLTLVRYAKPVKLLKSLDASGIEICSVSKGIYQIKRFGLLPVQFLILREIDFDEHPWLAALTKTLNEQQVQQLVHLGKNSWSDYERQNIEAVLNVSIRANQQMFNKVKGGDPMACEALFELMEDVFNARLDEKVAEKVAEELDKKVAEELDKKVAEELDKKVAAELDKKVTEELDKKVTEELDKKVTEELDKKVAEQLNEKVAEKMAEKIAENDAIIAKQVAEKDAEISALHRKIEQLELLSGISTAVL